MKNIRLFNLSNRVIQPLACIFTASIFIAGCASSPGLIDKTKNSINNNGNNGTNGTDGIGTNNSPESGQGNDQNNTSGSNGGSGDGSQDAGGSGDGSQDNPGGGNGDGDGDGNPVCGGSVSSSVSPATHLDGANIVFLIDDSVSMRDEVDRVKAQVGNFIASVSSLTNDNYRIVLLFDRSQSIFNDSNPFQSFLGSKIKYVNKRTNSNWADIAFFNSFAQNDFDQVLPNPVPTDCLFPFAASPSPNPIVCNPINYASTCSSLGQYYRPRYDINAGESSGAYKNETAACFNASSGSKLNISDYLLPNHAVNFIALSDDDYSASYAYDKFDYYNYNQNDSNKNAYPEVIYQMFQEILKPLGDAPIVYHSIVGLPVPGAAYTAHEALTDATGYAHLALSKKTGGATVSITSSSYASAFSEIKQRLAFSEISITLPCAVSSKSDIISVTLGSRTIAADQYKLSADKTKVILLQSAFLDSDIGQSAELIVNY